MAIENVPNQILRNIAEGLGISRLKLPFDRGIPGTPDPVNALLDDDLHGYAKKVRVKVNLPLRIDLPGAKLVAAFYMVREAQPDLRTSMMRSNDAATLSFSDAMGSAREVSVPTWLASLVSASDGSGRFEAQLGMARFPDGGIVVPPGGTDGLRGFMREQWNTGTETDKREIAKFLSTYMSGPKAKIADNRTLMPADRDKLIELLYRIAGPAANRPPAD